MQQQQGDCGKIRTSAVPSACPQSTSTVTSSSVIVSASSKTPTLSEEENMSNDGTQDAGKVCQFMVSTPCSVQVQSVRQESSDFESVECNFISVVFVRKFSFYLYSVSVV